MDPERQRIEEDLRGLVAGDVCCDELTTQLYATDASIYEIRPLGVICPRTTEDVVATVQYAATHNLAVHPRGSGSGLAGESLGRGLVIDFSRHMRRMLQLRDDSVRVQAGMVHGELNTLLAQQGRHFGPDPAMSDVTTLGGMVGIDASGSHYLKYGSTRHHVQAMRVVLADGERLDVSQHPVPAAPPTAESSDRLQQLVSGVAELITRNQDALAASSIHSEVNRSGYALDRVLRDGQLDLARLLVGSEGTLALTTEILVETQPLPVHTGCALLIFESLDNAARAVQEVLEQGPTACDLMDRRHLSLARQRDPRYELLIPVAAEAVLLVEQMGETAEEVEAKLRNLVKQIMVTSRMAAGAHVAADDQERQLYWQLAQKYVPTLYRMQGARRPIPFIEDIAVPIYALPVFLRHLQDALKREQVTASVFGHAGHGQLHVRPFLDLTNPNDVRRMETLASDLYEKVWLLGGTISGEHGDGLSRTPFLSRQYGPLVNVFRELKRLFDPQNILNPGKVVPAPGARMTHNMRRIVAALDSSPLSPSGEETNPPTTNEPHSLVTLALDWSHEEMTHAARLCNGCAACRTRDSESRMCPINRFAPREEATPRAKANLVRAVLTGQLPSDVLQQEAVKALADLCVHCHMCRIECPANVDIPKLVVETKANYVASNGLPVHEWLMTRIDDLSRLASRTPRLSNWMFHNRQARWLLEKILGISQARRLPRVAAKPFLRTLAKRGLTRSDGTDANRVAYFLDTHANLFDTDLAEAFVRVLEHNGVGVHVPPSQAHSAMPMISQGALEPAMRVARRNVAQLAEAVRRGYTIVATEPSAVLALTREYPALLQQDEDALLVAEHTQEACHYLWQLHQRGGLQLDFLSQDCDLAHHIPCHLKALEIGTPSENLLRLVPGLRVHRVEKGCSGMAGTWGLRRRNYRNSLRIGLPLIAAVRDGPYQVATTECSTCAIQIDQGAMKPILHPIKILAAAYGLAPPLPLAGESHV